MAQVCKSNTVIIKQLARPPVTGTDITVKPSELVIDLGILCPIPRSWMILRGFTPGWVFRAL